MNNKNMLDSHCKHDKEMREIREQKTGLLTSFKTVDQPTKNKIAKQLLSNGLYIKDK
jgi:hypothetical protein